MTLVKICLGKRCIVRRGLKGYWLFIDKFVRMFSRIRIFYAYYILILHPQKIFIVDCSILVLNGEP